MIDRRFDIFDPARSLDGAAIEPQPSLLDRIAVAEKAMSKLVGLMLELKLRNFVIETAFAQAVSKLPADRAMSLVADMRSGFTFDRAADNYGQLKLETEEHMNDLADRIEKILRQ